MCQGIALHLPLSLPLCHTLGNQGGARHHFCPISSDGRALGKNFVFAILVKFLASKRCPLHVHPYNKEQDFLVPSLEVLLEHSK
jgi:hypothetical protein